MLHSEHMIIVVSFKLRKGVIDTMFGVDLPVIHMQLVDLKKFLSAIKVDVVLLITLKWQHRSFESVVLTNQGVLFTFYCICL